RPQRLILAGAPLPHSRAAVGVYCADASSDAAPMTIFIAGLIVFLALHLVPALPGVRAALAARLGEARYKAAFSLLSLLGLAMIVGGYALATPGPRLFEPSRAAIAAAPYAVSLAFILLADGDTRGTLLFGSFLGYALLDLVSVLQRHASKRFEPSARYDLIAVVAG